MDTTKIKAAIDTAHQELNTIIDGEWKARRVAGMRALDLAAKALNLAAGHVETAAKRLLPKVVKPVKAGKK